MESLYLAHPWLDTVFDRRGGGTLVEHDIIPPDVEGAIEQEFNNGSLSPSEPAPQSLTASARTVLINKEMRRARRLIVRLRQPFGALLLVLSPIGRQGTEYHRVAADALITVRFQDNVPLDEALKTVRTLDVL